jgi:hypothetical protein
MKTIWLAGEFEDWSIGEMEYWSPAIIALFITVYCIAFLHHQCVNPFSPFSLILQAFN